MQLLNDVLKFWKDTWKDDKKLFFSELIGTVLGMVAAGLISFNSTDPDMLVILLLYLVSSLLMAYSSYKRKSAFLVVLMMFYTVTNIYGLINLFI